MEATESNRPQRTEWRLFARDDPHAAERYRDAISEYFDCELSESGDEFFNVAEFYHLGGQLLGRARSIGQRFTRSRASARRADVDHIKVVLQVSGTMRADYENRDIVCRPGSIRFLDMSRPYESTLDGYDFLDLIVPREALSAIVPESQLHGLVLDPGKPGADMLAAHLRTLWDQAGRMTQAEARASADAAVALVGGAVSGRINGASDHRAAIDRTLLVQARRYVDQHIGNAALGPETLGAYLGLSQRSLYRLMEEEGGVAAFIRGRRLEHAFREVVHGHRGGRTLAEIAYAHGFQSNAHFSRAFKARFGAQASELRGIGHVSDPAAARTGQEGFDTISAWLRAL